MRRALMGSCSEESCVLRMILLWAGKEPLSCVYIMGTAKPERSRSIAADFGGKRSSFCSQPQLATVQADLMVLVLPACEKTKQVLSVTGTWESGGDKVALLTAVGNDTHLFICGGSPGTLL